MSAMLPMDAVALGVGAFFGALSRYQCGKVAADFVATDPHRLGKLAGWHTAGINIGGSFLLGGISAIPSVDVKRVNGSPAKKSLFQGLSPRTRLMMGVGFCGSFTTFSAYSVDVVNWIAEGKTAKAAKYVTVNNVGGFVAAAAGMVLAKQVLG